MADKPKLAPKRADNRMVVTSLPTKPIEPPTDLESYKICLFGTKGIGKTTLANSFKNAYTLICEAPRRNLRINGYPNYAAGDPPLNYERASQVINLFLKSAYDLLIVDTADRLYELCQIHFRELHGIEHEGEIEYGKGWDKPRELFEELLNRVAFSNKGLIVISHVISKDRTNYVEDSVTQEVRPSLDKRPWAWVQTATDIVMCYDFVGNDRVLTIRGNERVMARCGLKDNFIADDGDELNAFLMPNKPEEGYERLMQAFDNELPDYYRQKEAEAQAKKKANVEKMAKVVAKKTAKK